MLNKNETAYENISTPIAFQHFDRLPKAIPISTNGMNLNKINPDVANTFVIYRHRTIVDKFIDLPATTENFKAISTVLDKTKSEYFDLSEPKHD